MSFVSWVDSGPKRRGAFNIAGIAPQMGLEIVD
jgi:hypothetical protein